MLNNHLRGRGSSIKTERFPKRALRLRAPSGNILYFHSLLLCPHHFPDFNLDKVFCIKNIFIMNDVTDFRKTVETSVDRAFSDSFDTVRACNIVK